MAFSDPIVLPYGPTYAAPTGGTSVNWRRIGDGAYVADGFGSLDEPYRFVIKNAPPANSADVTRTEVQLWRFKNPPVGSEATTDDFLVGSYVQRWHPRSFTTADMLPHAYTLMQFITNNMGRLALGER